MKLSQLVLSLPNVISQTSGDIEVTGVVSDSRDVKPGNLFVAFKGTSFDAHLFIQQAIANGAVAIVGTEDLLNLGVPYIKVNDSRYSLPYLVAAFYDHPAHKLVMIGVTGTDGKTTTTNLIYQILLAAGIKAGMISTVNAVIGERILDTGFHVTTPDAPDLQRYLSMMVEAGLTHAVIETTSHGWEQYRTDACEFDIGVITNITHEHLDEHGSYEKYRAAKARLFFGLGETPAKPFFSQKLAVLNQDDLSYSYLSSITTVPQITYGMSSASTFRASSIENRTDGLHFLVTKDDINFPIHCNILGSFNAYNCLAAISVAIHGLDIDIESAQKGIASLTGVPGRMEFINMGQDFISIVDFAHTPNALKCALDTVKTLVPGRVIAVFGSAGLRDKEKRRMMSEIAAAMADLTILTAEDPRTESLQEILEDMASGAEKRGSEEGKDFLRIADRGEAIRHAVFMARPDDLVIVCGKGHEQSMCFGQVEYPWDDRIAIRSALSERLGIPGPAMPKLPTSS